MIYRLFVDFHLLSLPTPIFDTLSVAQIIPVLYRFSHCVLGYNRKKDFNIMTAETGNEPNIADGVFRVNDDRMAND